MKVYNKRKTYSTPFGYKKIIYRIFNRIPYVAHGCIITHTQIHFLISCAYQLKKTYKCFPKGSLQFCRITKYVFTLSTTIYIERCNIWAWGCFIRIICINNGDEYKMCRTNKYRYSMRFNVCEINKFNF